MHGLRLATYLVGYIFGSVSVQQRVFALFPVNVRRADMRDHASMTISAQRVFEKPRQL